jgi:hypothetical protein
MVAGFVEIPAGTPIVLDHYNIYQDNEKIGEVVAPETTYTDSVSDGTSNYCVVAVYDNDAQSAKVCKPITCFSCVPVTDFVINYSADCKSATLEWESNAPLFNIYRDSVLIKENFDKTTYVDKNFDPTPHTWEVTVVCGASDESDPATLDMPVCLLPCKPVTNVTATYAEKVITVKWTAPAGLVPDYYEISLDGEDPDDATETEFTVDVSDLEEGNYEYEFCVTPVYGDDVCSGEVSKACKKVSFTIVGIKENAKTTFSIVPNPAHNNVTVSANYYFHTIEMVSFLGQTVLTQSNIGNTAKVDISDLANGVYFVRIISENGTKVQKFVKQ